jgi:lipid-binding SYLF domain-containing protein
MRTKLVFLLRSGLSTVVAFAQSEVKRLEEAAAVFSEVMDTPDKSIPQDLLNKATCIIVVPSLKKGAFIIGAKYGRGFASCRKQGGVGWSAPAAFRVEGGSFGFQAGGAESDVIMLMMNERGMNRLLQSKFTVGADATAAAGPVGRNAQADTDATMRAEILTWSRSRGLFAGVSLQGATLRPDEEVNRLLYKKSITNREILTTGVAPPQEAERLLGLLNKYSSRK